MNKKITKTLLLITLLFLLIGIASATSISNDTNTHENTEKVAPNTLNTIKTLEKNNKEVIEKKTIEKINKNKTVKRSSQTVDVSDFSTLHKTLTNDTYDTLTVNIKSDITLTNSIEVNKTIKTLTINGNYHIINGQNKYQFLNLANTTDLTINKIQVVKCYAEYGGAIYNRGNLTITDSTLNNNNAANEYGHGGAIYNWGTLTIIHTTLNNNRAGNDRGSGGAICNMGKLTITQYSTLNNNTAYHGGAISDFYTYNYNNVTIIESTLNNNKAVAYGGAIYLMRNGYLKIINCTFNNNGVSKTGIGGAIYASGVTVANSFFIKNTASSGGAIHGHRINITNSTLENNNAIEYYNSPDYLYRVTYEGNGGAIHGDYINLTDSTLNNNKAGISGGAIYGNSITITNCILNNNQATNYGGAINGKFNTIIQSTLNKNRATNYGGAINGSSNTIIQSTLNDNTAKYGGVIYIGANSTINSSIFKNNVASQEGGVIRTTNSNYYLFNNTFENNTSPEGGAIYHNKETNNVTITKNTFKNNKATSNGGALIFKDKSDNVIIKNNIFLNNIATKSGGAININTTNFTLESNIFKNNTVNQEGGAIRVNNSNANISNNVFENNKATGGGAVYLWGYNNNYTLKYNNFTNNSATGQSSSYGGALFTEAHANITNCKFNNNNAPANGGAIQCDQGLTITNSYFENNTAGNYGGAVRFYKTVNKTIIQNTTFTNNQAGNGGSIHFGENTDNITLKECKFNNNRAATDGGAINFEKLISNLNIDNNIFNNNSANYGGVINFHEINASSNKSIKNNKFNNNKAINGGVFAYWQQTSNIQYLNNIFENNTATRDGGAIYYDKQTDNIFFNKNLFISNTATNNGGALLTKGAGLIEENHFTNNSATDGAAIYNQGNISINKNIFKINNATNITKTAIENTGSNVIIKDNINENITPFKNTIYNTGSNLNITNNIFEIINTTLTIKVSDNTPTVTKDIIINTTLIDEYGNKLSNRNITLTIDEKTYNLLTNNNGEVTQKYTTNKTGTLIITAKYAGNNQYSNTTTTTNVSVKKMNIKISANTPTSTIRNTYTTITLLNQNNEKLTNKVVEVLQNNKIIANGTTNNNGETRVQLNLPAGRHTLNIRYNGDKTYNSNTNTTIAVVNKISTTTTITTSNNTVGNVIITGKVLYNNNNNNVPNGIITIKEGNNTIGTANVQNGVYTTKTSINTKGTHSITAQYQENDEYLSSKSATLTINVTPLTPTLTAKSEGTYTGETNITITLRDQTGKAIPNAPVTLTLPNKTTIQKTTDSNGFVRTPVNLPVGKQNIKIAYPGNTIYAPRNTTLDINVEKIPTTTTGRLLNNTAGNVTITGTVKDIFGKNVPNGIVTIRNANTEVGRTTVTNGVFTATTTINNAGNYPITLQYTGTNTYQTSNTNLGTITINPRNSQIIARSEGTLPGNTNIITTLKDTTTGKAITNAPITVTLPNGTNITTNTGSNGTVKVPVDLKEGPNTVTVTYPGNGTYKPISDKTTFNISKSPIKITLNPIKGIIGEKITLTAYITDTNGKPVSGGNLAFKLNGKTLRSDGRFDSSAPAMKFKVENGKVTYNIKADLYLRNAKNLTASYSGTNKYYETTSPSVTAQIQKRYAQVTVTSTPSYAKQYETLTFTVKAKDVTKNGKNNTLIHTGTKVMLKVNGVTLKDAKGKILYLTLDKNAQTTYKYTIPKGTGGITASKAQRNYTVTAIFIGENYYPGAKNTTKFQVTRSATYVNITQAKVTKTNILSVKATLKDYKGQNLIGTNKVTIKINGKSYTKNGKPVYWSVKNGNIDLTEIQIDPKTTIKRVLLVTGERQAYTEGRAETTNIIRT